jgi:transcriptional regulator
MYIPKIFEEKDLSRVYDFIREFSFATVVSSSNSRALATHTPLMIQIRDEKAILLGHISLANSQKDLLTDGAEVLCIFQGPHAYISPRWYTELNVPTWNYRSVHVYGTIKVLTGEEIRTVMSSMVDRYESGKEQPLKMEEIPPQVLEKEMKGIHVFEIAISEIHAAEKLSQNRDETSTKNIINQLKQDGDFNAMLLAFEMERRAKRK